MGGFDQVAWFPLCAGLTVLGLIISWPVWRRGGHAKGLRMVAWALVPLGVYLLGIVGLLWRIGTSILSWALRFVISPTVWAGVIVGGLAILLFVVSGVLRRRSPRAKPVTAETRAEAPAGSGAAVGGSAVGGAATEGKADDDDDLAEIEELLRRRGIH
ncbi:MAG: cellulose synthase [Streptosporangiaceae bacterium]